MSNQHEIVSLMLFYYLILCKANMIERIERLQGVNDFVFERFHDQMM